ncbi:MAG: hypothetical protein NTZ30_17290, partial [Planctomycetota bacterium]|nr:hypothetical protein [Planctomycetota bacterium]
AQGTSHSVALRFENKLLKKPRSRADASDEPFARKKPRGSTAKSAVARYLRMVMTSNEIKTGGKNPLLHNKVKAGQMAIPAKTGIL